MKILRILLVIFLSAVLVFGLWRRYQQQEKEGIKDDPISAFRQKLLTRFDGNPTDTTDSTNEPMDYNKGPLNTTADSRDDQENTTATLLPEFTTGTLTASDLQTILQNTPINGNETATLIMVQYCDYVQSQYCKQFFEEGTVFDYQNTLENNLAYIYKPLPISATAEGLLPHKALVCVGTTATSKQFMAFHNSLYQHQSAFDEGILRRLATEAGIEDIGGCLSSASVTFALQQDIKRNKDLFGITSLPTNVFINKNTMERIKVPGLYTLDEVTPALQYIDGK